MAVDGGELMRYVKVTEDSTRPEIAEAIGFLREKAKTCGAAEVRTEICNDVDELLEMYLAASA
jgi:hypothetical protein